MNILPKKSWHVRNKDNVARVRRDEAQAAEEELETRRRAERAEQEARTEYLRRKSRVALEQEDGGRDEGETSAVTETSEHLNLFPLEDALEKKGNAEYLREKKEEKEKQERAIGLLVSLGPGPGTEATPWYLKGRERDKKQVEEEEERVQKEKGKRKSVVEEEKEKKDLKIKDRLDPMKDIKKALKEKDRKEKKHKKKEKKYKVETKNSGSSVERLRAERLQREVEERRRAQALLNQRKDGEKVMEAKKQLDDRDRPYNTAFFPELARKRARRDQYDFL